jgi:hypothetical protein
MSSETERITNEVLNRHSWDKLEEHLDIAGFENAESQQRAADEPRILDTGTAGNGEAILETPQ